MMQSLLVVMAMQYLNVPYKWGGQNYLGLDCSGLVMKTFHDVGLTLPDMTAHGIYEYCLENGISSEQGVCESLIFFGTKEKIIHVGISIGTINGEWFMIEAGGAGRNSKTMTPEQLAKKDARVRIKPVLSRRDLVASIKLPYKKENL